MKHLFTLSTFVIIALAFWGLQNIEEEKEAAVSDISDPHFVDMYMHNFKLTAMGENGKPSYTLEATYFEHYNDETNSRLQQPVIHFLQSDNRWIVTAKTGEIDDRKNRIILRDEIVMKQLETDNPLYVETSKMVINTKKQIARSTQIVNIRNNQLTLQSTGMRLDNSKGELELLASVKGNYVKSN